MAVSEQQKTLNAKLWGYYQYYGRPTNSQCLWKFYRGICKLWLNRRTRGSRLTWQHIMPCSAATLCCNLGSALPG